MMMTMMNNYKVYKYTNVINNKVYIGQTCQSLQSRSGVNGVKYKECPYFWSAIQKYGWSNFIREILVDNLTFDEANYYEKFYIDYYNSTDINYGYNLLSGGQNNMQGAANPFFGHHHSEQTRQLMSKNHRDVSGKNNPMYNKHHTEKAKQKISEGRKGIYVGKNCPSYNRLKPVKNISLNQIFRNAQDAAESIGQDRRNGSTNIQKACNGRLKTAYSYEWQYITIEEFNNANQN